MFKNILVPIDLAAETLRGLQLKMAKKLMDPATGKIVVLYVMPAIPGYIQTELPVSLHQSAVAEAQTKMAELIAAAGLTDAAESIISEGHAAQVILEKAGKLSTELVVIASHDPDLSDYLLGSTAARVLRHAHCSVFVVRNLADEA